MCQDSKNCFFFSDAEISFVNDRCIVEVNDMVARPCMIAILELPIMLGLTTMRTFKLNI